MKKIISLSLVLALTGCGGETIFNSEAEDMQACIVGTWNNEGNISSVQYTEAYAEFYVYSEDGTFQYEKRAKLDYDLILLELLVGVERPVPKYQVIRKVGQWIYQDDMFYTQITDHVASLAATEEEALNEYPWDSLYGGTPIDDVTYAQVSGTTLHCDEAYLAEHVMKPVSENPLTYRSETQYAVQPNTSAGTGFSELVFNSDGTGTYERVTEGVYTNDYYNFYDMTYSYVGNIIRVVYADDDGEDTTRLFTYYGPVIKDGTNHSLFVRQ
ncbi:hypothetical protein [uncultured Thalassolituus sp.]|uniref:hypothetical protein n=1 Tax=uncultured Thalassolituus sp. TaxID=285273 RepID=UPI00261D9289|nr:hypothetical protein [uncultured Thalassolituus sp.]